MADKRTNEEVRKDIEREDEKKDVHINTGVTIAVISGISSGAGVLAVLSIGFLESFRQDVAAFWLSCIPFVFPFITGVAIAYRKQLANVGLHMAMLFATSLTGGAGYGYSIQPVYLNRHNCTAVSTDRGGCDKEALVYIYVIAGGIACGFAALGLLVTCCTCSSATKRRAKRESERQMREQREVERKNREVKHIKQNVGIHNASSYTPKPTTNQPSTISGSQPQTNGKAANGHQVDATTHL